MSIEDRQKEEISRLYVRLQSAHNERARYRAALEEVFDADECKVCKCQQKMGHTYDGIMFIHLQKMAERALK